MPTLRDLLPDVQSVIGLHPGDLAGFILEVLLAPTTGPKFHVRNFCGDTGLQYSTRGQGPQSDVMQACAEAWTWLETNGLICMHPEEGTHGWYVPTRRAREVGDRSGVKALIANQELPEHFLHPEIVQYSRSLYLQGRFDTAVFEAFKALEVEIRKAAKLGSDLIGTKLAARAFDPNGGPLTDMQVEAGEREALRNLMVGAVGSYKNPNSHRRVGLNAPAARELLMFASNLLRIVDERRVI